MTQNWRTEAHQIVAQAVRAEGLSLEEAAERFAITPRRVARILKGN